jgi:hypothetical protein
MCRKTWETVDHLLLHCDVASALWSSLFSRFGISSVMPRRVVDMLGCWRSSGRLRSTAVWKMLSICLFWRLWREINNRSFEDLEYLGRDSILILPYFVLLDYGLCPHFVFYFLSFLQVVNFIKSVKVPLSIQEVYKRIPKQERQGKGKNTRKTQTEGNPENPYKTSPQNPETNTSH